MSTRHYLPPTDQCDIRWIDISKWHKVKTTIGSLEGFPNTVGRVIERRNYILFEDERDFIMFKLAK